MKINEEVKVIARMTSQYDDYSDKIVATITYLVGRRIFREQE